MYEFETPSAVDLRVELQTGDVRIKAMDTTTTSIRLVPATGARELADETVVEQRDGQILVIAPRKSPTFFRRSPSMDVVVELPMDSSVDVRLKHGDVLTRGRLATVTARTGAGDVDLDQVTGPTDVATGSGDIELREGDGSVQMTTGSGDVSVQIIGEDARISTGSGDVYVRQVGGQLQVSSGSGDVEVEQPASDVSIKTGSGDQRVHRARSGQVSCQTASGDLRIGIANGVAAWLDVHSLTGSVQSSLGVAEPPTDGEPSVQIHANTVSGDISLDRA